MKSLFYNITDDNNVINKRLGEPIELDIKLRGNINTSTPSITLKSSVYPNFNYCYIEDFKKYYFITGIDVFNDNSYVIRMKCDVLETYKDDILKCYGLITKSTGGNPYINFDYDAEVRKEIDIHVSDIKLPNVKTKLLTTLGNGAM